MGAVVKAKHSRLLEPGSNSPRREGPKPTSEGMKAKAAVKIKSRLQDKAAISQEEKIKLAGGDQRIEEGRLQFASESAMASMGRFANKVEEMLTNKRQRSHESVAKVVCKGVFWVIFNKKQLACVLS